MIKKILICSFLFISTAIVSMEEETTKFIPPELKSKMMLYLTQAIQTIDLDQAIEIMKKQFKAPQFQEIFDKDVFFTEKVIGLLQKKYSYLIDAKIARLCIAAKLGTTASNKILRDEYDQNPRLFIAFIYNLIKSHKSYCAKELFEFAKRNFNEKDMKLLLLQKDEELGTNILMEAIMAGSNSTFIELLLELATKYLSLEEMNAFVNAQDRWRETPLSKAYQLKTFSLEEQIAEFEKIIALLRKNGAQETDLVKFWKYQAPARRY